MKKTASHIKNQSDNSDQFRRQYQLRERCQPSSSTPQQKSRKISDVKKELLISMVTQQNYRIKEAGRILAISYSTAKKIFTMFRNELRAKKDQQEDELIKYKAYLHCGIMECEEGGAQKVSVVSTLAGRPQKDLHECPHFNALQ